MQRLIWSFRLALFYAGIIPATIIIATCGWCLAPLPSLWCYRIITSWSHFFIWWVKITCGLRYSVKGRKNLPKAPFIVLCNHQSMWETIFMQVLLPPQSWVLKRELLWIPFFGWGLALIKPIAVYRDRLTDVKFILAQGKKRVSQGRCVVFYPEGTRLPVGKTKRFSRTGAALANATSLPIIPIAHNAGNFWPKGPWIKRKGTISVHIGEAIFPNDDPSNMTLQAQEWINKTKEEMQPKG